MLVSRKAKQRAIVYISFRKKMNSRNKNASVASRETAQRCEVKTKLYWKWKGRIPPNKITQSLKAFREKDKDS